MKSFIFIVIALFLLTIPVQVKAQGFNETARALNQSRIDLQEMIDSGFNVLRVNDTLSEAEQLFEAQDALMKTEGTPDFSLILERTNEITEIRKQAEEMGDELTALEERLGEIGNESETHAIFTKAKEEFADERYDKVTELIEEAYGKISEEKAIQTRFRAIYVASTKTIFDFFKKRWKEIIATLISIIIIYLVFHKRVAISLVNKKINNLNFEKEVLEKLIKKAQYEYFHLSIIPEELYHVRIDKFGELIRDTNRKVPLLLEEREKIKGKVEEEKEVEEKKTKKLNKKLRIVAISISLILVAGIFLSIYFKIISYNKILEFLQKLGFTAFLIAVITILAVLSAVSIFNYLKKKKEKEKPEIEKQKIFGFIQSLQEFLSNKIDRLKIYIKSLIERIKQVRQYKELLKQKREQEEQPKLRYLRKQKIILFKKNLQQKIHSVFHPSFTKREEEKSEENGEKQLQIEKLLEEKHRSIGLREENRKARGEVFDFPQTSKIVKTEEEKEPEKEPTEKQKKQEQPEENEVEFTEIPLSSPPEEKKKSKKIKKKEKEIKDGKEIKEEKEPEEKKKSEKTKKKRVKRKKE